MTDTAKLPISLAGAPPQQWLASPSPFYLTGEEALRLTSFANVGGLTLTVTGRILRPDNTIARINFTHTPSSSRVAATTIVSLSEGWLLGLTVRASAGAPAFGQVWANLELGNSLGATFAVDQTLGYGFLTANTPFAWLASVNTLPLDGPGNLRSITGTTPAAGAEISETAPTGARWKLLAIRSQLVCSATVATRTPSLSLDDGANEFFRTQDLDGVTASSSFGFSWGAGLAGPVLSNNNTLQQSLPTEVLLSGGFRFRTKTPGIQAADQWSAPQYLVREWMTGE